MALITEHSTIHCQQSMVRTAHQTLCMWEAIIRTIDAVINIYSSKLNNPFVLHCNRGRQLSLNFTVLGVK